MNGSNNKNVPHKAVTFFTVLLVLLSIAVAWPQLPQEVWKLVMELRSWLASLSTMGIMLIIIGFQIASLVFFWIFDRVRKVKPTR